LGKEITLDVVLSNATELDRRNLRDRFSKFDLQEDEHGRSIAPIAEHILTITAGVISLVNALLQLRREAIAQKKAVRLRHSSGNEIDLITSTEDTLREFIKGPKKASTAKK
jgi:hypothetical protein